MFHDSIRLQTKKTWANTQSKLLKATLRREFTLIQRTFFIYIFRSTQVLASCSIYPEFPFSSPDVHQQSVSSLSSTLNL